MKIKTLIIAGITLLATSVVAKVRTDIPTFVKENEILVVTIKNKHSKKKPFRAFFTFENGTELELDRTLRQKKRRADIVIPEVVATSKGVLRLEGGKKLPPLFHGLTIVDEADADLQGNDGQDGQDGQNGSVGPQGPAGPQGPQGPAGPKGDTGDQGPQGIAGPAGQDGVNGKDGNDGVGVTSSDTVNGETLIYLSNGSVLNLGSLKGDKGEKGDQGLKGDTGAQGPVGPRGLQGVAGKNGQDGNDGTDGVSVVSSSNVNGDTLLNLSNGSIINLGSLKGDKGDQGLQGPRGLTGPVGPRGLPGIQGPKGDTGNAGANGSDGTSVIGSNNVNSETILLLSNGSDINLGSLQGAKGDAGPQGIQGPIGPQGPKGQNGKNGRNGKDGIDGQDGVSVVKADVNNDGKLEIGLSNGSTIIAGKVVGPKGDKGDKGDKGMTGPRGPKGLQGPRGLIGAQGPKGEKGDAGQNGTDGISITSASVVNGELFIDLSNGSTQEAGSVPGIEDAKINSDGILLVKFTDGTIKALGKVVGEAGPQGPQGPQGPAGQGGNGETFFYNSTNLLSPTQRVNSMTSKLEHLTVKNVLHFGGSDSPDWEDDSRLGINKDALVVCRINHRKNKTELRFNIGNDFGNNKDISDTFTVGANSPDNRKFNKIFEVDSEGPGKVRIPSLAGGLRKGKVLTTDDEGNLILVKASQVLQNCDDD